jgi:hypothetical protein
MYEVMTTCVIMHNMIVEQERDDSLHDQGRQFEGELVEPPLGATTCENTQVRDRHISVLLQADIIEYPWAFSHHEGDEE